MAILSGFELQVRSTGVHGRLIHPFDVDSRRGAAYDLTIARDGCVLPDGKKIRPGEPVGLEHLLLQPGETAFVSTKEVLDVPLDLVGTISIKASYAHRGIQLLTGLLVDPGYQANPALERDGRLHFGVANLGGEPVELRLGQDKMVSIQFSLLNAAAQASPPATGVDNIWDRDDLNAGYGFVSQLRIAEEQLQALRSDFERQRQATDYLIVAAVLLLLTTILSFSLAALLSLGADGDFIRSVKAVVPDSSRDRWFAIGALALLALGTIGAANVVRAIRAPPSIPTVLSWRYTEANGRVQARVELWRSLVAAVATLVTAAVAWLLDSSGTDLSKLPVISMLIGIMLLLFGAGHWLVLRFGRPSARAFRKELERLGG